MHENEYNLAWQAKIDDYVKHKQKFVGGEFSKSMYYDNASGQDWTKKTKERKQTFSHTD